MAVGSVQVRIYTLEGKSNTLTAVSMRCHSLYKQNKHIHEERDREVSK